MIICKLPKNKLRLQGTYTFNPGELCRIYDRNQHLNRDNEDLRIHLAGDYAELKTHEERRWSAKNEQIRARRAIRLYSEPD